MIFYSFLLRDKLISVMNIMEADPGDYKLPSESCINPQTQTAVPTVPVSSMEICTLNVAKNLQIDDPTNYFKDGYENIKTYNVVFDQLSQTDRGESLCRKDPKKDQSYPNCALEFGLGFSPKSTNPSKCVPYKCPPGFTLNSGKTGCDKPKMIPSRKSQNEFCAEKWYDWFMIPNYHIGNKYVKLNDTCYKPCNPGFIPSFGVDPVDGYSPGLGSTDRPDMCASKQTYFGGKYNTPQDYCPLAAIKRLSSTRKTLIKDYEYAIQNKYKEANEIIDEKFKKNKLNKTIDKEVNEIINTSLNSKLDDIYPASQNDIVACRTLITDERIGEAYNTCKLLEENPNFYLTSMQADGVSSTAAELKVKLLKKACHALFCNPNDNPIASVSNTVYVSPDGIETVLDPKKTFCFPDVAEDKSLQTTVQGHNQSAVIANGGDSSKLTKQFVDIDKNQNPPIYNDVTDRMLLRIKMIPLLIGITVFIYVCYIFFTETTLGKWIWKKIKEISFKIWAFLTCLDVQQTKTTTESLNGS